MLIKYADMLQNGEQVIKETGEHVNVISGKGVWTFIMTKNGFPVLDHKLIKIT